MFARDFLQYLYNMWFNIIIKCVPKHTHDHMLGTAVFCQTSEFLFFVIVYRYYTEVCLEHLLNKYKKSSSADFRHGEGLTIGILLRIIRTIWCYICIQIRLRLWRLWWFLKYFETKQKHSIHYIYIYIINNRIRRGKKIIFN